MTTKSNLLGAERIQCLPDLYIQPLFPKTQTFIAILTSPLIVINTNNFSILSVQNPPLVPYLAQSKSLSFCMASQAAYALALPELLFLVSAILYLVLSAPATLALDVSQQ